MRRACFALALTAPSIATANEGEIIDAAVEAHIRPGFAALASESAALAEQAASDCAPTSAPLREAFHDAFDAWVSVSHLRFGPTEADNRAFALAFWPDPRGKTPKALAQLARDEDSIIADAEGFRTVSVAARGFYALERLLYAPPDGAKATYLCELTIAVAQDIAATSAEIEADWRTRYAPLMRAPYPEAGPYRNEEDALRALFTALTAGLKFTSELRLGRPLGTVERPRPRRAEDRKSVV